MVRIPEEVHILMRPEGGWIDMETLWHELGHGLSAVATDPSLPAVDRDLATTFNLSEAYAFLLQRMALSGRCWNR
jgi:oligoendopeptidase F